MTNPILPSVVSSFLGVLKISSCFAAAWDIFSLSISALPTKGSASEEKKADKFINNDDKIQKHILVQIENEDVHHHFSFV